MDFEKIPKIIISSLLASVLFIASAFFASIVGNIMLIIFPLGYGLILFYCLKSATKLELIIKELLTIPLTALFVLCSYHFELFPAIFIALLPSYGEPNAGAGFGVLLAMLFNLIISIIIFIVSFAKMPKQDDEK